MSFACTSRMMRKFIFLTSLLSLKLVAALILSDSHLFRSAMGRSNGILHIRRIFYVYWISLRFGGDPFASGHLQHPQASRWSLSRDCYRHWGMLRDSGWVAAIFFVRGCHRRWCSPRHLSGMKFMVSMVTQLQQTSSILYALPAAIRLFRLSVRWASPPQPNL